MYIKWLSFYHQRPEAIVNVYTSFPKLSFLYGHVIAEKQCSCTSVKIKPIFTSKPFKHNCVPLMFVHSSHYLNRIVFSSCTVLQQKMFSRFLLYWSIYEDMFLDKMPQFSFLIHIKSELFSWKCYLCIYMINIQYLSVSEKYRCAWINLT